MKVGYARTSTIDQVAGLDAQLRDLRTAGCEKVFAEQVSSVDETRPQLQAVFGFVREGDTLVVTKLDRLARSIKDLVDIEARLTAKAVSLSILSPSMDTTTPAGRLIFTVIGGIAQFEREIMLERQREGIARAKANGRYKGRPPMPTAVTDRVWALKEQGVSPTQIAKEIGIARSSVYRTLSVKSEP